MCYAAAEALADTVVNRPADTVTETPADAGAPPKAGAETSEATGPSLRRDHILPTMEEWSVFIDVAVAVGMKAMEQGVARRRTSPDELRQHADYMIRRSRDVTQDMMARGHIAAPDHGASD
jgi:malate dehydrogenase (oxaloacetate-decarboxylating)